jgi:hypothetical protein
VTGDELESCIRLADGDETKSAADVCESAAGVVGACGWCETWAKLSSA